MVSTVKVVVLAILISIALFLGSGVLTLTVILEKRKSVIQQRKLNKSQSSPSSSSSAASGDNAASSSLTETGIAREPGQQQQQQQEEEEEELANNGPKSKTIIPSTPVPDAELNLRQRLYPPPDGTNLRTVADAHFGVALRYIPFENNVDPAAAAAAGGQRQMKGNAIPPPLGRGAGYKLNGRGVDFVKTRKERALSTGRGGHHNEKRKNKRISSNNQGVGFDTNQSVSWVATLKYVLGLDGKFDGISGGGGTPIDWINDWVHNLIGGKTRDDNDDDDKGDVTDRADYVDGKASDGSTSSVDRRTNQHRSSLSSSSPTKKKTKRDAESEEALYHLMQASELGNPYAQHLVANALASGILPVDNSIQRYSFPNSTSSLVVPADFSEGGKQLASALMLWHLSAMDGVVESAMALGYRHLYSAMSGQTHGVSYESIITDADLRDDDNDDAVSPADSGGGGDDDDDDSKSGVEKTKKNQHSASSDAHYGVLGTCESALAYYEAAANAIMDELESSDLRGKVNPIIDKHRLAEIHMHGGASSALAQYNKPDELEEALQYYRMRASKSHQPEPDWNAAYTLANFYHYGMRGVKQDMKLALKYYEIAADAGSGEAARSREAAGQAGKFHFWGLGLEEEERDLTKAYKYFQIGTPGGLSGCTRRLRDARKKRKNNILPWEDEDDEDDVSQCDHPSLNGMGLLYLFGVPMILDANVDKARKYFMLARDMGNMDAAYNLAMMRLGWMTYDYVDDDKDESETDEENDDAADGSYSDRVDMKTADETTVSEKANAQKEEDNHIDKDNTDKAVGKKTASEEEASDSVSERSAPSKYSGTLPPHNINDYNVKNNRKSITDIAKAAATAVTKETTSKEDALMPEQVPQQEVKARGKFEKSGNLTKHDYRAALNDLALAANKGHMQAKHRLAMMFANGVVVQDPRNEGKKVQVIEKSCPKALAFYKSIADGGLTVSRRTRAAYKQYIAGDVESSLRNYLAAAETGSEIGQINAAFLLERGYCLGLNEDDCARASVRLWRAAARQGNSEACLRVGDFYYYGRMQKHNVTEQEASPGPGGKISPSGEKDLYVFGPFTWARYILYPEDLLPAMKSLMVRSVRWVLSHVEGRSKHGIGKDEVVAEKVTKRSCSEVEDDSTNGVCKIEDGPDYRKERMPRQSEMRKDLATAAQYYRMAAENHNSARAHFNLGFMHEWGLGLTQDFPLAKRHYDLAVAANAVEAELAVKIALTSMSLHEKFVVFRLALEEWWIESGWQQWWKESGWEGWLEQHTGIRGLFGELEPPLSSSLSSTPSSVPESSNTPMVAEEDRGGVGHPVPPGPKPRIASRTSKADIIMSHVLSWETLLIVVLTIILSRLIHRRMTRPGVPP